MAVRLRRFVWAGCLALLTSTAHAVVPPKGPRVQAEALTAMKAANVAKPLRVERRLAYGQAAPPLAWSHFVAQRGGSWQAAWDVATGVPSRIWGAGIPAPGTTANADLAERFARQMLADHIALLAPGASPADFVLVANHFDGSTRSIGFFQHAAGRRVLGGQVSFRFKNDRLFVIGSEALPHVAVAFPKTRLAPAVMRSKAIEGLRRELALPDAPVAALGDEVIVPLVADDAVLGYRLARPTEIDGGFEGRYVGYIDVATGGVVAVRQLNTYASGTLLYQTVDRYPSRGRMARPAAHAHVTVNGMMATTSPAGVVSWTPDGDASLETSVVGDFVSVVNKATDNAAAAAVFAISPGGQLVWDASGSEHADAQVNAYVASQIAKDYVRQHIDPLMPTIDEQLIVNVNIAQSCNAFFDGKTINFFQSSMTCQNTGLLLDVVYHEYGHRLHTAEIIPGVGDFDGAMSEGASDFLAASITGDPGMGRGFYLMNPDSPLRDLDPPDREWVWPRDVGEIHYTGQIYGGIFWDLRKQLIADLGEGPGIALTNRLYLATMRRAINIPTSLIEALAEDDDDGNLANGTPHECAIRAAFGLHGLRTATGTVIAPGRLEVSALAIGVHVEVTGLSERCEGDEVAGAKLHWVSYGTGPGSGSTDATPAGANKYFAQLPLKQQDSTYYKAVVKFTDGSELVLADNYADPYYQIYTGSTVKLYCTDFESTDPFAEGWTAGIDGAEQHQWQWGVPTAGASDPHAAFSGSRILAQQLDGDYSPRQRAWLKSPPIDIGRYSDVRLHYRRWLAVEDSHFDKARITANGKQAWLNFTGDMGDSSSQHHVDKEWRFQDVALSGFFRGHTVTVGWEITSDEGLELGGWHLDDVCIVANPSSICGDGVKSRTEQCDNGADNRNEPDACRTDCYLKTCGDGIVDTDELCDDGSEGSETCSETCQPIAPAEAGCCSTSGGAAGSLSLAGLVSMLLLGRRRRRRR